ncbi:MAG TPA: hypothetical protein DCW52_00065 [Gammaproteobacteria bacterium]|jgi:glycosyltransferase involved in cell wall biosynthesis|nr:glycosyltransferase [bacterium]HAU66769.1 hypothetical protein [Gammaproteobacteria bacterium]
MEYSKVSIITVCFNAASTIAETIESVATQVDADIEHIVIDGNSNDGTQSVVEAHLRDNLVFVSEPDEGLYDAMNKGVQLAKGDIIAFLNADDVYASANVVGHAVAAINENTVSCVYADLVFVDAIDTSLVKRVWSSQSHTPRLCFSGLDARASNVIHAAY